METVVHLDRKVAKTSRSQRLNSNNQRLFEGKAPAAEFLELSSWSNFLFDLHILKTLRQGDGQANLGSGLNRYVSWRHDLCHVKSENFISINNILCLSYLPLYVFQFCNGGDGCFCWMLGLNNVYRLFWLAVLHSVGGHDCLKPFLQRHDTLF